MEKGHLHMPGWMHIQKPDWHNVGVRFEHLIHDPRFWAVLALSVLLILMILSTLFAQKTNMMTTTPMGPIPYTLP